MAINYPTSLDTLTNPTGGDVLTSPDHAGQHADANDAIEALQAKVGIDSSAVTTSHDYKLSAITGSDKAAPATSPTFATSITGSYLTASEILITDGSKNIVSAPVATYPSLTELSYVKGVTSAIQTQLGNKQATISFGTGVETALGVNIGSAGAPVLFDGALGTPSSGVATNITGLVPGNLVAGTLAAKINLGEGADTATIGLEMDSALSADERYSGITVPGTAGATLAFGDLCYLDVTAGEWLLADADTASTAGSVILGICVDASTDGNATSMLVMGTVRSAAFPSSIALGATLYVSTTAGDITATAPSGTDDVIRVIGHAVTVEPNTIMFNPSNSWITHV